MFRYITLSVVLTAALMLLSACSNSDDAPTTAAPAETAPQEVLFNANVWRMMQGSPSRAATYDNAAALQADGTFTCVVYNKNTVTEYISPISVNWADSQWSFEGGKRYWPASGALDFFAYMPKTASLPSYISAGPTYNAGHDVTFTCSSLPMSYASATPAAGQGSGLKEFVYAMALDQDKEHQGASGVNLTFKHPFARIKLQLAASHPNVTINSITLIGIKNNGSFTYDYSEGTSTWSPSSDATNFTVTLTGDDAIFDNNPVTPTQIGEYFIMIPQGWAGEIVVNADCLFWGNKVNYPSLTTTIPTNWQPGYSYTYTFNISPDDLKVDIENTFTEQW